jgi:hypothetical protein
VNPTVAISIKGLTRSFGEVRAVAGVDLEILDGEFLTLFGPSGSGTGAGSVVGGGCRGRLSGAVVGGGCGPEPGPEYLNLGPDGRDLGPENGFLTADAMSSHPYPARRSREVEAVGG